MPPSLLPPVPVESPTLALKRRLVGLLVLLAAGLIISLAFHSPRTAPATASENLETVVVPVGQ